MKKHILLLLFITTLLSCNKDLKEANNFGEYLFHNLIDRSTDEILQLYISEKDTSKITDTSFISILRDSYKDSAFIKEYENSKEVEIKEWYKVAIDKGITKTNTSYLRTEIDTTNNGSTDFKLFFLLNNKEYFFIAPFVQKMKDGWKITGITPPTNTEEEQQRMEQLPYKPYSLNFTHANWVYKNVSVNVFHRFYLTISNGTSNDFDRIRYKVTISQTMKDGTKNLIFSKTIERNEKIYAGDIVPFEVLELRNLYVGSDISKGNFDWEAEVIDAKPRPKDQ
jgi:hypothetical protein